MDESADYNSELQAALAGGDLLAYLTNVSFRAAENVASALVRLMQGKETELYSQINAKTLSDLTREKSRSVEQVLAEVLPKLDGELSELLGISHALIDLCEQPGSEHSAISMFEKWLESHASKSEEALSALESDTRDSPLLLSTLLAFAKVNAGEAVSRAVAICDDQRPVMRRHAVMALGYMELCGEHLQSANDFLVERSGPETMELDRANAISAIHRRLQGIEDQKDKPPQLFEALQSACNNPSPAVVNEIVRGLILEKIKHPPSLKASIFDLMSDVRADQPQTIDLIDMVLYGLDLDAERDLVLRVVSGMLTNGPKAIGIDALDSTKHKLAAEPPSVLGWYIVELLLDGRQPLGEAASRIFPPLDVKLYAFDLAPHNLSQNEVFYLVRKVYAYLMLDRGPAVSLLAACLKFLSGEVLKAMEGEIASFWLENYPGDIAMFERVLDTSPELKPSVKRLKKAKDAYLKGLSDGRGNDAFKPSPPERQAQWDRRRKEQHEIAKQAHKSSVFLSFIHTKTMLYGRGAVSYIYGTGADEPTRHEMLYQSHETSTPIPRMDLHCPERLAYLRLRFRMEERPK
ncbi:hypothetical protein Q9K01_08115 [Qipengyuania sp. DY56-A-20]|jgi:hypothetical protein|uniref:HEAT repeat domain-containing protein n=1 Tax=Qipengyuania benthica TaxID=3067651 RepID=A0ABT9H8E2_9SPHN|nr:hypothetical protein [Qipengyuania sp. DY56-A-20]MDP4539583.1 hypothetical protein [Qipengyuania sp. DY56-A-20]